MESEDQSALDRSGSHELDFALPEMLTRPLWKSLAGNLRDRLVPERLPPLELTSRPVNTGMLVSDILALPWYRTVFTSIGDVIAPETLPPLELESRPMEVDELLSDRMSHLWWSSLLRNLADSVAPERLPALQLTSKPVNASLRSGSVQVLRWSSLASWPQVKRETGGPSSAPLAATAGSSSRMPVVVATSFPSQRLAVPAEAVHAHGSKLMGKLTRSRIREAFWIGIAFAEVTYLLVIWIWPK